MSQPYLGLGISYDLIILMQLKAMIIFLLKNNITLYSRPEEVTDVL
jgi:hypothetical protein